ncbi:MAG: tRNA lysidine(34) synthetase TilS [Acidobacteriota bacterium]
MSGERQVVEKFIKTIEKYGMINDGDRVLVALSGGVDSVALLFLMLDLASKFRIEVCAAHLNHMLRGKESNEDERFVKSLCCNIEIDFLIHRADVKKITREEKKSIEVAARDARMKFLNEAAGNLHATRIALGHTMNDQAENLLLRLLRGSGVTGLSSMKPADGNIIRPLLWIEREQLEAYLRSRRIAFRIDSSNEDMRFTRNRIRHTLIPILQDEFNPKIIPTLARTAEILSEEDAFLDSLTMDILLQKSGIRSTSRKARNKTAEEITSRKEAVAFHSELIKDVAPALGRRLIRSAIKIVKGDLKKVKFIDIERVRDLATGRSGRRVLLPSGIDAKIFKQEIVISRSSLAEHATKNILKRVNVEGRTSIDDAGILIEAKIVKADDFSENLKNGGKEKAFLDFDKVGKKLFIRSVREGDSFHPFNAPGKKKISDFFIDRKVTPEKRRGALVLTSDDRIVWVVGHEIDDRYKVNDKTWSVLVLEIRQL